MTQKNGNPGAGGTGASLARRGEPSPRRPRPARFARRVDFECINAAALAALPQLLANLLPSGQRIGREYVALNPRRVDRALGSFRINLATGRWADFAIEGARGGDPVSLVAYIEGVSQAEAALCLAGRLAL